MAAWVIAPYEDEILDPVAVVFCEEEVYDWIESHGDGGEYYFIEVPTHGTNEEYHRPVHQYVWRWQRGFSASPRRLPHKMAGSTTYGRQ